ncbi:hypothetical protein, partial [uncultured Enterococcus sp.]|uniref:hypothetical protein n=1 Tax=uncultured Enterococcus sp. TaxID=167972 RepID=UPI00258ED956
NVSGYPQENLPQVLLSDTFPIFVAKKPQNNGSPLLCEKQAFKIDFFFIFLFSFLKFPLKSRQKHTSQRKGVFFL